jgi:hypothetical protein
VNTISSGCMHFNSPWKMPRLYEFLLISDIFMDVSILYDSVYRPLSSDVQDEWGQCEDCQNSSLHARLLGGTSTPVFLHDSCFKIRTSIFRTDLLHRYRYLARTSTWCGWEDWQSLTLSDSLDLTKR